MKRLPPIPTAMMLSCGPIKVVRRKLAAKGLAGTYSFHKRLITIDADLSPVPAWLTLEHELVHAILMDVGLQVNEHTENVCNAIAAARVAEMVSPKTRSKRRGE